MKLYKIGKLKADHGVSVFPPELQELPPPEDAMAEPIRDLINNLKLYGYSEDQAYKIISAWAYHAKHDLNQAARGVRVFCEMCIHQLPKPIPPTPPAWHGFALLVAIFAAVALGLYLWVTLDKEIGIPFPGHPWAYLMSYQERLWQGEILNVGSRQMGYYEQSAEIGGTVLEHARGKSKVGGDDWFWFELGSLVLKGRRIIFYHFYMISGFYVEFCGVMTNVGVGLYKLREGGDDRFKPRGPWSRPGSRWGTAAYEGCWGKWWWL